MQVQYDDGEEDFEYLDGMRWKLEGHAEPPRHNHKGPKAQGAQSAAKAARVGNTPCTPIPNIETPNSEP